MNAKRIYLIKIAPVVLLAGTAYWLLGSDFFAFLTWWEMLFLLGLVFMPVTSRMFRGFDDNGWMFSKGTGGCGMRICTMATGLSEDLSIYRNHLCDPHGYLLPWKSFIWNQM